MSKKVYLTCDILNHAFKKRGVVHLIDMNYYFDKARNKYPCQVLKWYMRTRPYIKKVWLEDDSTYYDTGTYRWLLFYIAHKYLWLRLNQSIVRK